MPSREEAARAHVVFWLHFAPAGGPVGVIGASLELRPLPFFSVEGGIGTSPDNLPNSYQVAPQHHEPPHTQLSVHARLRQPEARYPAFFGLGYSRGRYFAASTWGPCDRAEGTCPKPMAEYPIAPFVDWLNVECGVEMSLGGPLRGRLAAGLSFAMKPGEILSQTDQGILGYVDFSLGVAFLISLIQSIAVVERVACGVRASPHAVTSNGTRSPRSHGVETARARRFRGGGAR